MYQKLINNQFVKTLVFAVIFFAAILLFLPIRFEENDDIVMLLLASGNYTGKLESNLIFIQPIYGVFLNILYSITNKIEWYTMLFIFFHFISFIIICFELFTNKLPNPIQYCLIILFSVLELNLLIYLQFTTVAFIMVLSGFILFDVKSKSKLIVSFILIFIASLLRFEAVVLFFLILLPYYLYQNYQLKSYKQFYLLVGLVSSLFLINYLSKIVANNDWKEYQEYNQYRRKINDNPLADNTASIYKGICSDEQYALLKDFYIDPKVIDKQALKRMSENVNRKNSLYDYVNNSIIQLSNYKYELVLLLLMSIFLHIIFKGKKLKIGILTYSAIILCLMVYITLDATLKNRVFIGILFAVLFLFILIFKTINWNKYIIIFFGSVFLIFSFFYLKRLNEKILDTNIKRSGLFLEQTNKLDDFFKKNKNVYITPFSSELILEYVNPFSVSFKFKEYHFLLSGWMTETPYNKKILTGIYNSKNMLHLFVNCYYKNYKIIDYFTFQYKTKELILSMTKKC